jgi:hypothetical protein
MRSNFPSVLFDICWGCLDDHSFIFDGDLTPQVPYSPVFLLVSSDNIEFPTSQWCRRQGQHSNTRREDEALHLVSLWIPFYEPFSADADTRRNSVPPYYWLSPLCRELAPEETKALFSGIPITGLDLDVRAHQH